MHWCFASYVTLKWTPYTGVFHTGSRGSPWSHERFLRWRGSEILIVQYNIKSTACSQDWSVGIAKDYRSDDLGSIPNKDDKFFSFHIVQNVSGAHPASYPMAYQDDFSPEVKRPWSEVDHSPQTSTGIKNCGITPPFPHTSSWCGA
jgi:hypothetical protein